MASAKTASVLLCLSTFLGACANLDFRPLNPSAPSIDCHGGLQQDEDVFSGLEDSLRRAGAFWTPKMKLFSGVGMLEKSARLYILNRKRHVLVLHLMHNVELEIEDYRAAARSDTAAIFAGVLRIDTKHTTGQVTDEYLYLDLSAEEAAGLSREAEINLSVGDLDFGMPYPCREPLRKAVAAVTDRHPGP